MFLSYNIELTFSENMKYFIKKKINFGEKYVEHVFEPKSENWIGQCVK